MKNFKTLFTYSVEALERIGHPEYYDVDENIEGELYDKLVNPRNISREDFNASLNEVYFIHLRKERNDRIAKTDYLFTSDYPHASEEAKQAWLDYSQALRDLPANTADPKNPDWPTPPTL